MKSVRRRLNLKKTRSFVVWFYLIGLMGFGLPFTREFFMEIVSWSLLFAFILLMLFHRDGSKAFLPLAVLVALAGYFVEVLGVKTGMIFGTYFYGGGFGIRILETPILIALNWLMLVYCSYYLASRINMAALLQILVAALMMLVYDFFLEPVATAMDWWYWQGGQIPLNNYLAWFVISLVFTGLFKVFRVKYKNPLASLIFFSQLGFFIILHLINLLFYS